MLTYDTAFEVVKRSIRNAGRGEATSDSQSLADLGLVGNATIQPLIPHIVREVQGLQQMIDTSLLSSSLQSSLTVADVTNHVMRLSAGKLCSNPKTPHEQTCCPYPANCPQCGYEVK